MHLPTANTICKDVENSLILLGRLFDFEQNLTDEEWDSLVYYDQRYPIARRRFIEAIEEIRSGDRRPDDLDDLPDHAQWLLFVYTGHHLSSEMANRGSRFHNRIMNDLADPYSVLDQIDDLKIALDVLKQKFSQVKPEVIDNIAVDESLEQLGRAMGPNE